MPTRVDTGLWPYEVPVSGERCTPRCSARPSGLRTCAREAKRGLILGRAVERLTVHEVEGNERETFVKDYADDPRQVSRLRFALRAEPSKLSPEGLKQAMAVLPVFHVEAAP